MPSKNKAIKRASEARWRKKNPEYLRGWYARNKEKMRAYRKKWREANKEKVKIAGSRANYRNYKISIDEAMAIKSAGCLICGVREGRLCIDHCHKTGRIRGCLCHSCNCVLGHAKDSIEMLKKAIQYLERYPT